MSGLPREAPQSTNPLDAVGSAAKTANEGCAIDAAARRDRQRPLGRDLDELERRRARGFGDERHGRRPRQDATGPATNPAIKIMDIVALQLLAALAG
jgi:Na+/H+-translocating membrane pyrophosphatase